MREDTVIGLMELDTTTHHREPSPEARLFFLCVPCRLRLLGFSSGNVMPCKESDGKSTNFFLSFFARFAICFCCCNLPYFFSQSTPLSSMRLPFYRASLYTISDIQTYHTTFQQSKRQSPKPQDFKQHIFLGDNTMAFIMFVSVYHAKQQQKSRRRDLKLMSRSFIKIVFVFLRKIVLQNKKQGCFYAFGHLKYLP